jgi:hypothetical protein
MARAPAGFPAAQQASLAKRVKMAVGGVKAARRSVRKALMRPPPRWYWPVFWIVGLVIVVGEVVWRALAG